VNVFAIDKDQALIAGEAEFSGSMLALDLTRDGDEHTGSGVGILCDYLEVAALTGEGGQGGTEPGCTLISLDGLRLPLSETESDCACPDGEGP
jgi:hypothetical protein